MTPCPRCGAAVQPGTRFCPQCGLNVQPAVGQPQPQPGSNWTPPAQPVPGPTGAYPPNQPTAQPLPQPQPHPRKPSKKRTGLLIGLSAGAVVVVLALVAALVLPGMLENDDFQTAPPMSTSPQLVNSWTSSDGDSGLVGYPGQFHARDKGLMLMGSTHGGPYRMESLDTGRTLWTMSFSGVCRLGTQGILTCVDVDGSGLRLARGVTLFDLRSGEELHQFSLPEEPVELSPLPDGGLVIAVAYSGTRTSWIRLDDRGREQWRSTLPEGSWSGITVHGAAVTASRWDDSGNRPGVVRSLATGEPLPGVPDEAPVALLPGGEIQVGSNPALVLDKEGQGKLNLPGSTAGVVQSASSLFHQTISDGSVRAYVTMVNDVPTIRNDKGDMVVRSHILAAVCNGTILTVREGSTSGSPKRQRIGFDSRGDEVMRVDLPWNASFYPGCDGDRFVEVTTERSRGVIVAYDRSGVIWETPVEGSFGFVTSDGVYVSDDRDSTYLYR